MFITGSRVYRILDGGNSDLSTGEPNISQPGVIGISASGPGVRGVGVVERGGVFESRIFDVHPLAQVRLVPTILPDQVFPIGQDPVPPTDEGEAGDLLALTYRDPNNQIRAALFFCIGGVHTEGNTSGSALWARLA